MDTFFTVSAEFFISTFPTSVEPVKDIFLIILFVHNSDPIFSGLFATSRLITPFGIPATSAKCTSALAERGVCSAGFIITVHPAAIAGATFLVIIAAGKFHGVINAHTPTGCLIVTILLSFCVAGILLP